MANPIVPVKSGEKSHPWQIDSITGATISSKAIAKILREGSRDWVPVIYSQLAVFEQAGGTDNGS